MKENDISELDMDLTFSVNEEVFGQVRKEPCIFKPVFTDTAEDVN